MRLIKYFVFALILGYTAEWTMIKLLLSSLGKDQPPVTIVKNENLSQLAKDKTGVKIDSIKISETERPFGMMVGIPGKPQLILARGLYDSFADDEMEYVILHETGHYQLQHTIKELMLGLGLLFLGIWLLKKIKANKLALPTAAVLGVLLGAAFIQLGKYHEFEADRFALARINNPQGMINATEKFRNYHGAKYSQNSNPVIQWLFYRSNPYDNRIRMAEEVINSKK